MTNKKPDLVKLRIKIFPNIAFTMCSERLLNIPPNGWVKSSEISFSGKKRRDIGNKIKEFIRSFTEFIAFIFIYFYSQPKLMTYE